MVEEHQLPEEDKNLTEEIAELIKIIFIHCSLLIPHIKLLESSDELSRQITSQVDASAVLIEALGGDYQKDRLEAIIKEKRSKALLNLIKVLSETEKERKEFYEKSERNSLALGRLKKAMGVS